MSFDGTGNFTRVHNWQDDQANGYKIEPSRMDAEDDGFATGLSNTICRDGQSTISANIPFNSKKITGLGDGSALTDSINFKQSQNSSGKYAVSGGTDTITLTLVPAITAYVAGQKFCFKAGGTNTGTVTLNINSVGAKDILLPDGSALAAGDITVNRIYSVIYDGTDFILLNRFDSKTASEVAADVASNWVANAPAGTQIGYASVSASTFSTTSNSYEDVTGLSIAYTPKHADSKLLITVQTDELYASYDYGSAVTDALISTFLHLTDGTNNKVIGRPYLRASSRSDGLASIYNSGAFVAEFPATNTNARTIKAQLRAITSGHNACINTPLMYIQEIKQ